MKHRDDDYVVVSGKETKPYLAKIKEVNENAKTLTVIPDKLRYQGIVEVEMPYSGVLVNLGKDPAPGKVYGVDVSNRYRKSIESDFWGVLHFFVKPEKAVLDRLRKGLDETAKRLEKLGLREYTTRFQTEIRAKKGKYAGMYQHRQENKSIVWYAPEMADDQAQMNYVIYHEFGHVLRFNGLNRVKMRARWQKLFQQSVTPTLVTKKYLSGLWDHVKLSADGEASLGSVIKEFQKDEEATDAYLKALSRWFRQVHHISPRDLQVLWEANDLDTIESLWPLGSIDTSKLSPLISDYATKNVEETFAEAFAFHMTDKKLPAHVEKLLEKSLSIIKEAA